MSADTVQSRSDAGRDSSRSLVELKSALWSAANTLPGSAADHTDWKGYILALLFFNRISEV